ncbi:mitochondrial biogenesis AIM24-domain-containing protein [Dipodascopsis tothii]|uniref:mitochondrial biogenesis AIM24-domain-containing protein n=1 Tax=Dipodascopsis tothii TaxID=44089 RepID=UPI0034CF2B05
MIGTAQSRAVARKAVHGPRRTSGRPAARRIHVSQSPVSTVPVSLDNGTGDVSDLVQNVPRINGDGPFPLAPKFSVIGAPASLLSVALPASATLHARRGTLVAVNSRDLGAVSSTLSVLAPMQRALTGIPFLYQKVVSTTPLTALVGCPKTPNSTFAVVTMDGRQDWTVVSKDSLLAWTGATLTVRARALPRIRTLGTSFLSGRGEIALVGRGNVYQVTLKEGDEVAVRPGNVVAFSGGEEVGIGPEIFRLRHSRLRLQVPWLPQLGGSTLLAGAAESPVYKAAANGWATAMAWVRRLVWGDNVFVRFKGPTTVLLQSRGAQLADVIPAAERREVAVFGAASKAERAAEAAAEAAASAAAAAPAAAATVDADAAAPAAAAAVSKGGLLKVATVKDGKVTFESTDSFREFTR